MSAVQGAIYINFHGKAYEALTFYQQTLGGDLTMTAMDAQGARPASPGDRVGFARLDTGGLVITGSDGHPSYPPTAGDNWGVAISSADRDEMTRIFAALAEGGAVKSPLVKQPWGGEAGWIADQFGVTWQVSVSQS